MAQDMSGRKMKETNNNRGFNVRGEMTLKRWAVLMVPIVIFGYLFGSWAARELPLYAAILGCFAVGIIGYWYGKCADKIYKWLKI